MSLSRNLGLRHSKRGLNISTCNFKSLFYIESAAGRGGFPASSLLRKYLKKWILIKNKCKDWVCLKKPSSWLCRRIRNWLYRRCYRSKETIPEKLQNTFHNPGKFVEHKEIRIRNYNMCEYTGWLQQKGFPFDNTITLRIT